MVTVPVDNGQPWPGWLFLDGPQRLAISLERRGSEPYLIERPIVGEAGPRWPRLMVIVAVLFEALLKSLDEGWGRVAVPLLSMARSWSPLGVCQINGV